MEHVFQVGDKCKLKSTGEIITIASISTSPFHDCYWAEGDNSGYYCDTDLERV